MFRLKWFEEPREKEAAIVLLGGGMDSLLAGFLARRRTKQLYGLHATYGQKSAPVERWASERIARSLEFSGFATIDLTILQYFSELASTALVTGEVPHISWPEVETRQPRVAEVSLAVYVPFRQGTLFALAAAWGEALCRRYGLDRVWIYVGGNADDVPYFPDERPEFIRYWNEALRVGIAFGSVRIATPLINLTKVQIAKALARHQLLDLVRYTVSCYRSPGLTRINGILQPIHCPNPLEVGEACPACVRRATAFQDAGVPDPTAYYCEDMEVLRPE